MALSKHYRGVAALSDLTMTVPRGEVFGFLGPNGAGKTTSVKLLMGLARPTSGQAWVLGAPLGDRATRRHIGYLPELFRYQGWLRAREVLGLHCELARLPRASWTGEVDDALTAVGLAERGQDRVGTFSKGMQQRLGLGVALLGGPTMVFLDEPSSALDPVGRRDVREIIRTLKARGTTIFLNSHLLTEVEQVCDRVAIVDHGRVVAIGTLDGLLAARVGVRVRATGVDEGARAELAGFGEVSESEGWISIAGATPEDVTEVVAGLVARGARVYAVEPRHQSLEERFMELLGGDRQGRGRGPVSAVDIQPWAVWVIARLTVREASRRKLLMALLVLTAVVISLTLIGFYLIKGIGGTTEPLTPLEVKTITSQLLIFVMFLFSFVLALSAVFVAAPQISGDVESGIALSMLTRPISRVDVVLGKWLGLVAVMAVYIAGAVALELVGVKLITDYQPPEPLWLVGYLVAEAVVLMTLALMISTRLSGMTGGVIALGAYGISWIGGIAGAIGTAFQNSTVTHVGTITQLLLPTDGLWRGAVYSLEPATFITVARSAGTAGRGLAANPFFAMNGPEPAYLGWVAAWLVALLALTVYSFQKREI